MYGYIDVKDVNEFSGSGPYVVAVQFSHQYEGQAKNVLLAAPSGFSLHPKMAMAVDEDVNIYDPAEVFWTTANRVDPQKDVFIIEGTRNHPFDLKLSLLTDYEVRQRLGSKMGIDATRPPTSKPQAREAFERARPMGWSKVKLEDFLK